MEKMCAKKRIFFKKKKKNLLPADVTLNFLLMKHLLGITVLKSIWVLPTSGKPHLGWLLLAQ